MAILPILTAPDPRLKKKSKPVETVDAELRQLMDDMLETMYAAPGIGLAAPQVGVLTRLIVLAALGLGGVIYALTVGPVDGWDKTAVLAAGIGGIIATSSFVLVERFSRHPLLPLQMFHSRQFTAANVITFVVYGALGGTLFLLPIQLQRVVGLSALQSGSALIPMTIVMLLLVVAVSLGVMWMGRHREVMN